MATLILNEITVENVSHNLHYDLEDVNADIATQREMLMLLIGDTSKRSHDDSGYLDVPWVDHYHYKVNEILEELERLYIRRAYLGLGFMDDDSTFSKLVDDNDKSLRPSSDSVCVVINDNNTTSVFTYPNTAVGLVRSYNKFVNILRDRNIDNPETYANNREYCDRNSDFSVVIVESNVSTESEDSD